MERKNTKKKKVILMSTCFAEDWPIVQALILNPPQPNDDGIDDDVESKFHCSLLIRPISKSIGAHSIWARLRIALVQARVNYLCSEGQYWTTPDPQPALENGQTEIVDIHCQEMNSTSTQALIESHNPDYLVVCGGPILKSNIFNIPSIASINLHWGITPLMRGAESSFWALYLGKFDAIGMTLHKIDKGVDTGTVLAQGRPSLNRSDDEVICWYKNGKVAILLLLEVLNHANPNDIRNAGQRSKSRVGDGDDDDSGQYFRYKDHCWYHDVWLFIKRLISPRYSRAPKTMGGMQFFY